MKLKSGDVVTGARDVENGLGATFVTLNRKYEILPNVVGELCFLSDDGSLITVFGSCDQWFVPTEDPFDYAMSIL